MSFQVVVTKSLPPVLVVPSEPTPAGSLPLPSTDKCRLGVSTTSLHLFDHPIDQPAESVHRALSHALVPYHPIAGRFAVGPNSDIIQLACTRQGVAFVAATADCTLEDARFLHAPLAIPLPDLVLRYGGRCRMSDPLLMLQVTEFACGGYVVAVTWNHALADGFGLAQFLQAVGELARGAPRPSIVPVRYDPSLPEIPQLGATLAPRLAGRGHVDFAYTDATIPWSFINRVKADFSHSQQQDHGHAGLGQSSCSTFEVVAATIWQCRTRATTANGGAAADEPVMLMFAANVRNHVGAKDGYYGNCITSQLVTAASGAVANGDIVEVVKLVKRGKEQIRDTIETGEVPVVVEEELVGALRGDGFLLVSSWRGIGMEEVDLGGGRPARVMANMEMTVLPACLVCPPRSSKKCTGGGDDGVNVMALCVREEHADGFHAELATLR